MSKAATPILEMRGIVKQFGSAVVNDHIDFTVYPGEVHALLGENGAGKTTLMNILYGMYHPDEGEILLRGEPIRITSPRVSLEHGIGMVHQHFMLVDAFTSSENVFLMTNQSSLSRIRKGTMESELQNLADKYGMEVDVSSPVSQLSVGMQQRVEILKLLYVGAEILIMDEPTAVLAPQECDVLFEIIEKLTADNKSIIFVSHKLEEVLRISDRITILRDGKLAETALNENLNKQKIIEMLLGSAFEAEMHEKAATSYTKCPLVAEGLEGKDSRGVQTLNRVSLSVREGEVLGIAGLEGNGQEELMDILAGLKQPTSGTIEVDGEDLTGRDANAFTKAGVAYVPTDRNHVATVGVMPLYQNWELRRAGGEKGKWKFDGKKLAQETKDAITDYDIRVSGHDEKTMNLSGGNLQKFILARELDKDPKILILSNPTRGIDVKASWDIRNRILTARDNGMAVIISSGDLEELFYLADRMIVLFRGAIKKEVDPKHITVNELGSLMLGVDP